MFTRARRHRRHPAVRAAALEPLEGRRLFAAVPVATGSPVPVPSHQSTQLTPGAVHLPAAVAASPELTATITWGDGTRSSAADLYRPADDPTLVYASAGHGYARPGTYAQRVTFADADGHVVGRVRATQAVTRNATTPVAVHARAGRAFDGVLATYTSDEPLVGAGSRVDAFVVWGDGTTSEATQVARRTSGGRYVVEFRGTHTYAAAGRYAVTVGGEVSQQPTGPGQVTNDLVTSLATTDGTAVVRR